MFSFQFEKQWEKVKKLCDDALFILSNCQKEKVQTLVQEFQAFFSAYCQQTKMTIAFIGQYNAGKSTLIKALTGDRGVQISAGICTDRVTEYVWQEVLLIDTPGVYAGRNDHDQMTLDKISQSDLLVFVIPNELFNPQGGAFFKRVANDMQRIGQLALVVNKMSRERGRPQDLLPAILEVTEPYHPNDFYTCFIDADSYLKAQSELDEEEKEILLEDANFDTFLDSLQKLIKKNQLSARLLTPLHRVIDTLEQSRKYLFTEDQASHNLIEILRRKILVLRASKTRFRNHYCAILRDLEHNVAMIGEKVASNIDGYHNEEEINIEITRAGREIELASEKALEEIQSALEEELNHLQIQLEELIKSPLGRLLFEEFAVSSNARDRVRFREDKQGSNYASFLKNSPETLRGIGSLSSKVSRDLVYGVGRFFGVKFKPWGAVNTAKFIRGLGPVLAIVGSILDIILTIIDVQEKNQYETKLREAREEIRQEFRQVASEICNEYKVNLEKEILLGFYEEEIKEVERHQCSFKDKEQSQKNLVEQIENKLKEIKSEISSFE